MHSLRFVGGCEDSGNDEEFAALAHIEFRLGKQESKLSPSAARSIVASTSNDVALSSPLQTMTSVDPTALPETRTCLGVSTRISAILGLVTETRVIMFAGATTFDRPTATLTAGAVAMCEAG